MNKKWLDKLWYQQNRLAWLLSPLGHLYGLGMRLRRFCFNQGICRVTHFAVPVIVVGNITVGGTGKTPLVAALAIKLRERGYSPGLVSRGYGGRAATWPQTVSAETDPALVGEEAVWLAQKTGCPMVVDPNRVQAVKTLLAAYSCDVVMSDDGLQHLSLGRDYQIAVIDGARGFGNQHVLPAGPLRESLSSLVAVNCLVINNTDKVPYWLQKSTIARRQFLMKLQPRGIYNLLNPELQLNVLQAAEQPIHACAGIGHPQRFINSLNSLGFKTIIPHVFSDHHHYTPQEVDFGSNALVVMTEKDAVKCRKFANPTHWGLMMEAVVDEGLFDDLLVTVKRKKLSL